LLDTTTSYNYFVASKIWAGWGPRYARKHSNLSKVWKIFYLCSRLDL